MLPCFINIVKKAQFVAAYKFFIDCYKPKATPVKAPICEDSKEEVPGIHYV